MKIFSIIMICAAMLFMPASAMSAGKTPTEELSAAMTDIIGLLKDPAYANSATRAPLRQKIIARAEQIFDYTEFSSRTVGARWSSFTDDQKQRFNQSMGRLISVAYLDNISGYNGQGIEFTGEKYSKSGDKVEVQGLFTTSDGKKVPANFRMLKKADTWLVYDTIIENVSLIKNYRAQFKEVLLKGDADTLISRVDERAKSLSEQQKNGNAAK